MGSRALEALIDFVSNVLYLVASKHIGLDRAFQQVYHSSIGGKAVRLVRLKTLYQVSRRVVLDYYTLRWIELKVYGSHGGAKRLVRLWLTLRAEPELLSDLWPHVERLRRRMERTTPRFIDSVEDAIEEIDDPVMRIAVKHSYPYWLVEKLAKLMGLSETEKLLEWLNEEVWWIRVNTLKADIDDVIRRLEEKGVIVRRDAELPYMLRVLDYTEPLHHLEEMWRGEIIFQDKASALVVEALEPSENDVILDLASAPGVKATQIMQLTGNRARIVLCDISWERIRRMQRLLKMYGVDLSRVDIVLCDSTTMKLRIKPSKVLVDAPCSSSGVVGKDPAVKIHLEDYAWATRHTTTQKLMLRNAIEYGAEVVYATCSILPEEGEEIVSPYESLLVNPDVKGSPGYPSYTFRDRVRRFFPHLHETQGFFLAKLKPLEDG